MRPITRREAIGFGMLGGAGVLVGGLGLSRTGLPWIASPAPATEDVGGSAGGESLVEPEVLRSQDGVLRVELVAAQTVTSIAGRQARVLTYNGTVPGPSWWVRPGDSIEVRLRNELGTPTNLHTHGLAVSPQGNGDNPFVSIEPGQDFDYRFELPADHPPGVFWYHPHRHGTVADQLFGGLYGALIVDGDQVPVSRDRVLVISDISLTDDSQIAPVSDQEVMLGREGELVLVNGQHQPQLTARPGQRERWRVINACTSRYLRLALGGQRLELLGIDGGRETAHREVQEVLLAPGNRADLLVTMRGGISELRTLGHDRGGMGMMGGAELSGPGTLATLAVTGDEAAAPGVAPDLPAVPDLRDRPIAGQREITFTMTMGTMMGAGRNMMEFGFDGRVFDATRTDQQVSVGTVEEWLISNPTPMDHPFHLHVWPMQLIEAAGQEIGEPTRRDVVNVPARSRVRVLVDFTSHPGRSVYHCHILDHEDAGMMASIEVV
ncbi:MAG: multicopper oxidase family protein [Brooklawnia sp.]|uniref:multicopper oxidase family protein n=1 Tax=Brooklawnia sp. TaxID=2699740 RepID=UPI003C748E1B